MGLPTKKNNEDGWREQCSQRTEVNGKFHLKTSLCTKEAGAYPGFFFRATRLKKYQVVARRKAAFYPAGKHVERGRRGRVGVLYG